MAKITEKEVLDEIKKPTTTVDTISRYIEEYDPDNEPFPSPHDIQIDFRFEDPFSIPKYCNQENYSFAWLDPKDDIHMHRALNVDYFRIVTRSSSCFDRSIRIQDRDFRSHGAIERRGLILGFRPKDLDAKLRSISVETHNSMLSSISAGKQGDGYNTSFIKYQEGDSSNAAARDRDAKFTVVAEEEAGEVGIKNV